MAYPVIASIQLLYVDPATGGLFFQVVGVIFAAISGALFFFSRQVKLAWARIKRFVNQHRSRSPAARD